MRMFLLVLCTLLLMAAESALAQSSPAGPKPASLDGVKWSGAAPPNYESLKGKTVIVMTYVTWCPKCNLWSPDLCSQLQKSSSDRPVVVLAVSTDTPADKARQYMAGKGLAGPNVFHGYDPKLATAFGFTNKFFNYVVIDPDGNVAETGNAGSHYTEGPKTYVVARKASEAKGQFRFITDEMSASLKNMLWPAELGQTASLEKGLKQAEKGLSTKDKGLLKGSIDKFLNGELEAAKNLSKGTVPERITALEKSSFLSTAFRTSEQGKDAKLIYGELALDKDMKKELAAKKVYDQCAQMPPSPRRASLLKSAAKRFADTHYGALAEQAASQ